MARTIREKYVEIKKTNPNIDMEMVETFMSEMPREASMLFDRMTYGCHIVDSEMYEDAMNTYKWASGTGQGVKWTVEDITKLSGIDFSTKDYTVHDYAYAVNALYSLYCNIFTDSTTYLKMARNFLETADYPGDPSERAYHDAKERIEYYGI